MNVADEAPESGDGIRGTKVVHKHDSFGAMRGPMIRDIKCVAEACDARVHTLNG